MKKTYYTSLLQSPYSSDLAPSQFYLFADLIKMLTEKRLGGNEEVIAETDAYYATKDKLLYKKGIQMLKKRRNYCIALGRKLC